MPIQPSQVVSRANSDLCRARLALDDVGRPSAERMAEIVRIADGFRAAVAGSTHDPLRGEVVPHLPGHSVCPSCGALPGHQRP